MELQQNQPQMEKKLLSQSTAQKQSIQQNRVDQNRLQIIGTAIILIAALLPFLNNFLKFISPIINYDPDAIVPNTVGKEYLYFDTVIYYLAVPCVAILVGIAQFLKPYKFSYYILIASGYFHLITYINFIFFNNNNIDVIAKIAIVAILCLLLVLIYFLSNYQKSLEDRDKFNISTIDRLISILKKKNSL